jgi:hypothetical protein
MKQSIDPKVVVGIVLAVLVVVGVVWWRGLSGPHVEATGAVSAPRHIKPGGPPISGGSPSTTPGAGP